MTDAASEAIEPFRIRVDDAVLDDLRDRLARTRFPDQIDDTGWEYGIPVDYLRELVAYWRDEYDWRAHEARLNELPTFPHAVDGQSIHFVHVAPRPSPPTTAPDPFPLLLMHGWPGAFTEFLDVIPRLTDEFDVVVPSLPGYGFSGPTRTRGWDVPRIARAFVELDGAPRLHALRRAGRRLGRADRDPNRRARSRALRRDPSQHADRGTPGRRRRAQPPRTRRISRRWRTSSARSPATRSSSRRSRRRSASRSTTHRRPCSRG